MAQFSVAITLLCVLGFMIPFDYVNPEQWAFVKSVSEVCRVVYVRHMAVRDVACVFTFGWKLLGNVSYLRSLDPPLL